MNKGLLKDGFWVTVSRRLQEKAQSVHLEFQHKMWDIETELVLPAGKFQVSHNLSQIYYVSSVASP
jgi:hypothetical protein